MAKRSDTKGSSEVVNQRTHNTMAKRSDTKGSSEVVNQRTHNTMAKRSDTKGNTMIHKTLQKKLKIVNHEADNTQG
jgi:hypothetical protein